MEGYRVKLQKVERPTNRSYYVNFPVAVTEALGIEKGEKFEWIIEDKNTLIFKRVIPVLQEKKVKLTPMQRVSRDLTIVAPGCTCNGYKQCPQSRV